MKLTVPKGSNAAFRNVLTALMRNYETVNAPATSNTHVTPNLSLSIP